MARYIAQRLLFLIPTLLGITLITFMIIQLAPGSPVSLKLLGPGGAGVRSDLISKEVIEQTKKLYGLDQPFYIQYGRWIQRLMTLDFGESYKDRRPVWDKIKEALPVTLLLNIISIFLIYLISIPAGIFSAVRPQSFLDKFTTLIFFILYFL